MRRLRQWFALHVIGVYCGLMLVVAAANMAMGFYLWPSLGTAVNFWLAGYLVATVVDDARVRHALGAVTALQRLLAMPRVRPLTEAEIAQLERNVLQGLQRTAAILRAQGYRIEEPPQAKMH